MSTLKRREAPLQLQSSKLQLQRQTAALLAERRSLESVLNLSPSPIYIRPPAESASLTPIVHKENEKTQEVITRLQEIIRLCRQEGNLSNEEMREVVKMETQVLNYLQQKGQEQIIPEVKAPVPDKPKTEQNAKSQLQTRAELSGNTLEVIEEIERKALGEIIHLQNERDSLKQERDQLLAQLKARAQGSKIGLNEEKLKEENRLLREENSALNIRLNTITSNHLQREPGSDYERGNLSHGQYDSQIAVYENELRRASAVINELKAQLGNVAGLEELHEQGQRIRRETAELLRYKGKNDGEDYSVLRELQERLQEEEQGKAAFLEELKSFKQSYLQLEQENRELKSRINFEPLARPSPAGETIAAARSGNRKRSGVDDYETTLKELRQALR